jgi:carbamate kinase
MIAVIAFGGNALLRPEDNGTVTEQLHRANDAALWLVPLTHQGYKLAVVHGNGPQVGNLTIQMEEAATKIPPLPIDVCDAMTEGSMGYLLETAIQNQFKKMGKAVRMATILTPVQVDGADPGFKNPTKPIGPFYTKFRAEQLSKEFGWTLKEDAGRGWRKVVPSPKPQKILNMDLIREILKVRDVVVAGGGGGIPVTVDADGIWRGVEAVIDKDYTASLIAQELNADLFIILTGVARVARDYGKPSQKFYSELTLSEARALMAEGQFPAGSMGPKIDAALQFVEATNKPVLITDSQTLAMALEKKSGTYLVKDPPEEETK